MSPLSPHGIAQFCPRSTLSMSEITVLCRNLGRGARGGRRRQGCVSVEAARAARPVVETLELAPVMANSKPDLRPFRARQYSADRGRAVD